MNKRKGILPESFSDQSSSLQYMDCFSIMFYISAHCFIFTVFSFNIYGFSSTCTRQQTDTGSDELVKMAAGNDVFSHQLITGELTFRLLYRD